MNDSPTNGLLPGKEDCISDRHFKLLLTILLSFSAFLIFYAIRNNSLHGVDEARYSIISKDMLASGDWITPHIGTDPYYRKPPLRFWLQAPLFYLFGYSEWVVRFWSALAALSCIGFTVLMGRKLFGSSAGLWAGFALATCLQFLYIHSATTGEMDAILLFFTTSSLYYFLKSEENPSYLLLSAILMGLASLTKNLAGFIPLGIAILYVLISGKWNVYRKGRVGLSILLLLVLSFSWILAMLAIHREDFLRNYFFRQIYQRAVSDEFYSGMDNARGWHGGLFFIGRTMFAGFFPWSLLIVPACIAGISRFREWRKSGRILPLIWFLVFLIGLILFKNKFHWYILPLYPPACILLGHYLAASFSGNTYRWKAFLLGALLIFGMLIFVPDFSFNPFIFVDVETELRILMLSPYMKGALFIAAILTLLWFILLQRSVRVAHYAIAILLFCYSIFYVCLPLRFSETKSEVHLLVNDIVQEATQPKNTLFLWDIPIITLTNSKEPMWGSAIIARWYFYSIPRTRLYFLSANEKEVKTLLLEGGNKIFLILESDYTKMKADLPHHYIKARSVNGRTYVLIRPI